MTGGRRARDRAPRPRARLHGRGEDRHRREAHRRALLAPGSQRLSRRLRARRSPAPRRPGDGRHAALRDDQRHPPEGVHGRHGGGPDLPAHRRGRLAVPQGAPFGQRGSAGARRALAGRGASPTSADRPVGARGAGRFRRAARCAAGRIDARPAWSERPGRPSTPWAASDWAPSSSAAERWRDTCRRRARSSIGAPRPGSGCTAIHRRQADAEALGP